VPVTWILPVFLLSGFSALLYQIVWQRSLYAIYGIHVESVTIIVTAFMLGLGLGSLVGGALSRDRRRPVLLLFAAVELAIGLFGFWSLRLFQFVGSFTLQLSPFVTAVCSFLLLLVPTLLMGATLPLLVTDLVRASKNVGRAVGVLYCVNTLGSALAALAASVLLLGWLGQRGVTVLAALINFAVSASVLILYRTRSRA
jgi:predicted membrane-bound spermidine synthase